MAKIQIIDNIIRVDMESSTYVFDCSRLSSYSTDVQDYDIEYIFANLTKNYLTVIVTVASGQAGIIAVVDIDTDKIVHIQNGSFSIAALLVNEKVISFNFVSFWGQLPYYTIESTEFGNINMEAESKSIKIPNEIEFDLNNNKISLHVESSKLKISDGNKVHIEDISELIK